MGSYAYLPLERVVFGQPAAPAAAEAVRAADPNLILTVGGGTPIDTVKNRWVLANPQPIRSEADVMQLLEAA